MMKLKTIVVPGMATCGLILAQPAWAQSRPTAGAATAARATIDDADLNLSVTVSGELNFREIKRPNGVVAGAQCRYSLTPTNGPTTQAVAEIRNGQVFDPTFPTPSGCEFSQTTSQIPTFTVNCSAATPVTIRAEWASGDRDGVTLTGVSQGIYEPLTNSSGQAFSFNLANNSVLTCPELEQGSGVRFKVGGTLTLDANASTTFDAPVGTVILNATY